MNNDEERVCLSLTEVLTYVWHNITREEAMERINRIRPDGIVNQFGEVEFDPDFLEDAEIEDWSYEAIEIRLSSDHNTEVEQKFEDPEMVHIRRMMGNNGPSA